MSRLRYDVQQWAVVFKYNTINIPEDVTVGGSYGSAG